MTDRWLYPWALGSIAFGGASLLIPLYIVQLGATPFQLGVLAATAAAIGAPGAILFGRLANRLDRRRTLLLITLTTVAVALASIPFMTNVTAIIVVNAGLWLVVAAVAPVLTMIVVDDVPESAWSQRIGLLNKYQGYGWAGGLVLGTVWPLVSIRVLDAGTATRVLFWLLAACAAASVVGVARTVPRPATDGHLTGERKVRRVTRLVTNSRRGIKGVTFAFSPNRLYWTTRDIDLRRLTGRLDSTIGLYLVAAGLFFTGSAAFWAPLPLLLSETGFTTGQIFGLYLVASLTSAVLYEGAGTLATRYDTSWLQSGALAVRSVCFPAVAVSLGIGSVSVKLGVVGIGLALVGLTWAVIAVVGTVIVTALSPQAIRGEVLGVYTALGAVAGGVGGLLGGWTASFGYTVAFGIAGGLVMLGAVLVLSIRARTEGDRGDSAPTSLPE